MELSVSPTPEMATDNSIECMQPITIRISKWEVRDTTAGYMLHSIESTFLLTESHVAMCN